MDETGCFRRDEHIKRPVDFRRLFKEGKKVSVAGAKLYFLPNNLEFNRIGFPLPRGYGNAVQRNRAKRFSRETYRKLKSHLNNGYDILFLVYPPSEKDSFSTRCDQLQTLLGKAGLFKA
ncbi:MAG: ribonuclease P protein component [Treponema sp.]|nr:ribonuclease P protein component [Candidatus Treponema equifaecale]